MVGSTTNTLSPNRASSVTAYCALFALAILQLGVALHHDAHSATDLTSNCVACAQLEQFDDVLVANDVDCVVAPDNARAVCVATQPTSFRIARYYQSRAPPAIS